VAPIEISPFDAPRVMLALLPPLPEEPYALPLRSVIPAARTIDPPVLVTLMAPAVPPPPVPYESPPRALMLASPFWPIVTPPLLAI